MNNELTPEFLAAMIPGATLVELDWKATQVHWKDGDVEKSITFFHSDSLAAEMRNVSKFMNDVKWKGNIRFSSTF